MLCRRVVSSALLEPAAAHSNETLHQALKTRTENERVIKNLIGRTFGMYLCNRPFVVGLHCEVNYNIVWMSNGASAGMRVVM